MLMEESTDSFSSHHRFKIILISFIFSSSRLQSSLAAFELSHAWISNDIKLRSKVLFRYLSMEYREPYQYGKASSLKTKCEQRAGQFSMAHALTSNFRQCDFNAAFFHR